MALQGQVAKLQTVVESLVVTCVSLDARISVLEHSEEGWRLISRRSVHEDGRPVTWHDCRRWAREDVLKLIREFNANAAPDAKRLPETPGHCSKGTFFHKRAMELWKEMGGTPGKRRKKNTKTESPSEASMESVYVQASEQSHDEEL